MVVAQVEVVILRYRYRLRIRFVEEGFAVDVFADVVEEAAVVLYPLAIRASMYSSSRPDRVLISGLSLSVA